MRKTRKEPPQKTPGRDSPFAGKIALVTGAGSGIGRATAKLLAHRGAKVAAISRTAVEVESLVKELGGEKAGHLAVGGDVSDECSIRDAHRRIRERYGRIDLLVANAGVDGTWASLDALEVAEWDKTLGNNLRGTFLTVKLFGDMLRRGSAIVVVSSINGNRVFSSLGACAYSTSKAAQVVFMKMIALELAVKGVRINAVCPGSIDTEIDDNSRERDTKGLIPPVRFPEGNIPLTRGKAGKPEQVARLAAFLLSDDADHITGTEVFIDGGQSLLKG